MKKKTINAVICKKVDAWLASIDDESLRAQVKDNVVVTGGCIASMLLNEPVNDFDVYFRTREVALSVANYYVEKFKAAKPGEREHIKVVDDGQRVSIRVQSAGVASENDDERYDAARQMAEDEKEEIAKLIDDGETLLAIADKEEPDKDKRPKYRPVFLSCNAISLSDDIQIVIRFYGDPETIHSTFDFAHAMCHWSSSDRKVVLKPEALECLLNKELRYVGSRYPLCSLFRMKKFIQRGWRINAGNILRIAWNLRDYDLSRIDVLEEQLVGCDTFFFLQLIEALKQHNKDKTGDDALRVDTLYLSQMIDKLFN